MDRNISAALVALFMSVFIAMPAFAVTDAEKEALRANCRSDFIAHCMGTPPDGVEAFECLAKNEESLSSACQAAVKAVDLAVK